MARGDRVDVEQTAQRAPGGLVVVCCVVCGQSRGSGTENMLAAGRGAEREEEPRALQVREAL